MIQPSKEPGLLGYMVNKVVEAANAKGVVRRDEVCTELIEALAEYDHLILLYPEFKPDGSLGVAPLLVTLRETEDEMLRSNALLVENEATALMIGEQVQALTQRPSGSQSY